MIFTNMSTKKRPEDTYFYTGIGGLVFALCLFWLFGNPSFDVQLFDTYLVLTWFHLISIIALISFLIGGIVWMLRRL